MSSLRPFYNAKPDYYVHCYEMQKCGFRTRFDWTICRSVGRFRQEAKCQYLWQSMFGQNFRSTSLLLDILEVLVRINEFKRAVELNCGCELKEVILQLLEEDQLRLKQALEDVRKQSAIEISLMREIAAKRQLP